MHAPQLAVNESLLARVADAVTVGQKIVGHFKHAAFCLPVLEDIQGQLNQANKRTSAGYEDLLEIARTTRHNLEYSCSSMSLSNSYHSSVGALGKERKRSFLFWLRLRN